MALIFSIFLYTAVIFLVPLMVKIADTWTDTDQYTAL
jgi:hypothetical protein